MPKLTVDGIGRSMFRTASGWYWLSKDEAKIDQLHACGGNARCTTCRVEFIAGEPGQMTAAEKGVLEARGLLGTVRLSCQILCDHDMSVRGSAGWPGADNSTPANGRPMRSNLSRSHSWPLLPASKCSARKDTDGDSARPPGPPSGVGRCAGRPRSICCGLIRPASHQPTNRPTYGPGVHLAPMVGRNKDAARRANNCHAEWRRRTAADRAIG